MEKGYERKDPTSGLSLKRKIAIRGRRIASLVPALFKKMQNGFKKFFKTITKPVDFVVDKMRDYAMEEVAHKTNEKIDKLQEKIELKEEEALKVEDEAIFNAYIKDIGELEKKKIKAKTAPRRLLVAGQFMKKMIGNVGKSIVGAGKAVVGVTASGLKLAGEGIVMGAGAVAHGTQTVAQGIAHGVGSGYNAVRQGAHALKTAATLAPDMIKIYCDMVKAQLQSEALAKQANENVNRFANLYNISPELREVIQAEVIDQNGFVIANTPVYSETVEKKIM